LAILDMLADTVHVAYGLTAVFGVTAQAAGVRAGINGYLGAYLPEEHGRCREYPAVFEERAHEKDVERAIRLRFPAMSRSFDRCRLEISPGEIRTGEVLGVVGANGIGKSTFARLLAGVEEPDEGPLSGETRISYKPQYLKAMSSDTVEFSLRQITRSFDSSAYQHDIIEPLSLSPLLQSPIDTLSGGELQRVAIAACLSRDADLYVLDE